MFSFIYHFTSSANIEQWEITPPDLYSIQGKQLLYIYDNNVSSCYLWNILVCRYFS